MLNITFLPKNKGLVCSKCGKYALKVIPNPNKNKKYSRNNDDYITSCCKSRMVLGDIYEY
jgi:hypothetical protein